MEAFFFLESSKFCKFRVIFYLYRAIFEHIYSGHTAQHHETIQSDPASHDANAGYSVIDEDYGNNTIFIGYTAIIVL